MIAVAEKAQIFHTHYSPHPADDSLADHISPATEILTFFFPTNYSESDQKKFEDDLKKMVAVIEKEATTYKASAGGWVVEEIPIPDTSDKAKAYTALIGWESVEAHLAFRETQAFKDNIHLLRQAKDLKKLHVVHYHGTQVNKGAGGVGDFSAADMSAQEEVLNPQGGGKSAPKTAADGSTTKNNDDLKGAANSTKKERAGR